LPLTLFSSLEIDRITSSLFKYVSCYQAILSLHNQSAHPVKWLWCRQRRGGCRVDENRLESTHWRVYRREQRRERVDENVE